MDGAGFPTANRTNGGAWRFNVVHDTFKACCASDKMPGAHGLLIDIVEALLVEVARRHDPRAGVAWLLASDAVPNPFGDNRDVLAFVDLYLQLSQVAKREGIDFEKLPREVRKLILKRGRSMLPTNKGAATEGVKLDKTAL